MIIKNEDETFKGMLLTAAARELNFLEIQERVRTAAYRGLRKIVLTASSETIQKRMKQEFS
jgi:hypothetical protein